MNGCMMDWQLTIQKILTRANKVYKDREVISLYADLSEHRYTYGDFYHRVLKLINALQKLGIQPGDRVATFAWNHYRHLELYFAITSMGAVLHTLNIRLFPDQLRYIVNHADDKLIFVDQSLIDALAPHKDHFKKVQNYIVMDDKSPEPKNTLPNILLYEDLLSKAEAKESLPEIRENDAAGLCYTSGTTGDPKGVLYSHRSMYLHSMSLLAVDSVGLSERDAVLPIVPMFHANSWGLPFACPMVGAKVVFPAMHLNGETLSKLIEKEKVTLSIGVPTILGLLQQHLKSNKHDVSTIRAMVAGGSAVPESLIRSFQENFGIDIIQGWGMTETSPIGTISLVRSAQTHLSEDEKFHIKAKQGTPVPGIELAILDDDGKEMPWDGESVGELCIRGPWVASEYFKNEEATKNSFTKDGWFQTGDVASIDPNGIMQITDRKKDLIKTRGEWISSVDMENSVMACEGVLEAAVVARPDDLRSEAPVVFAVVHEKQKDKVSAKVIHDKLKKEFANWQIPKLADIHFIESIPKTSVGKFDKKVLRKKLNEELAASK